MPIIDIKDRLAANAANPMRKFGVRNNVENFGVYKNKSTHIIEIKVRQGCCDCSAESTFITHHYANSTLARIALHIIGNSNILDEYINLPRSFDHLLWAFSPHVRIGKCTCGAELMQSSSMGLEHLSSFEFSGGLAADTAFEYLTMSVTAL